MNESTISAVDKLSTFIDHYPAEHLRDQFKLLEVDFPDHRKVKGDGNCLYRAFAFEYLTKNKIQRSAFPDCKNICKNSHYSQQQFSRKFNNIIQQLSELDCQVKDQTIQDKFNSDEFDEIIITYFRSANYEFILKHKQKYFQYFDEDKSIAHELDRISTIHAETEGIELPALAELFNVRLYIYFIDEKTFNPVVFNESKGQISIYLFYRPGHYDIVYPSEDKKESRFRSKLKIKPKATPIKKVDQMIKNVRIGSQPSAPHTPQNTIKKPQPETQSHQFKAYTHNTKNLAPNATATTFSSQKEENSKSYVEELQKKINKPKNIKTSQSWNQSNKIGMELFAVGLVLSVGYFFYSNI